MDESVYLSKDNHLLCIYFELIGYEKTEKYKNNYVWLKCENGWCTFPIFPEKHFEGITGVEYPYEEPPSSIEVWSGNGYLISRHSLDVTEGSIEEIKEWREQKKGILTLRDMDENILMTGGIASVSVKQTEEGSYSVRIKFTDSAAEAFYSITSDYIGEHIAIYLYDKMIISPLVQTAISDGVCWISPLDYERAEQLALMIGGFGTYVMNGNEITIYGASANDKEEYEFTSAYTLEIPDGETLYLYNVETGAGIE